VSIDNDVEERDRGLFKALYQHLLGGSEENHENLGQYRRSSGRDQNPGPPDYEAGTLTTTQRPSVKESGCNSRTIFSMFQQSNSSGDLRFFLSV
jgi:hypothetical protein